MGAASVCGSPALRTTNVVTMRSPIACGKYTAGRGSSASLRCRTSPTTPVTSTREPSPERPHGLADRIPVGPEAPRGGLADQHWHGSTRSKVQLLGQRLAPEQGDPHRLQVAGADVAPVRAKNSGVRRSAAVRPGEFPRLPDFRLKREAVDGADIQDAWQRRDPLGDFGPPPDEMRPDVGAGNARDVVLKGDGENALPIEARIDRAQREEASRHQRRADDEHNGQADFRDHQRAPHPAAAADRSRGRLSGGS